ncbi:hypothetical protein pEaSNUABM54_00163 [Erwinia phage pEa_SNUABM_54]|nr:hypothetical protein pEaSNUABM54_00163 [Erwinia phage pEa_SNUABM_54]
MVLVEIPKDNNSIEVDDTLMARYGDAVRFVIENNDSKGAYHTTHHLLGVATILCSMFNRLSPDALTQVQRDTLVYAALFHDFDHPGTGDDVLNIKTTIDALYAKDAWSVIPKELSLDVYNAINETLWPAPADLVISDVNWYLRDADQLYATVYLTPELSRELFKELGPRFNVPTYSQWLFRNVEYVMSLPGALHYECAKYVYDCHLPKSLKIHFAELYKQIDGE